jgi:signal transduction histidine kinase
METGKGKILVVDDEEGMRDSIVQVLGREGFEVESASNGLEALEKVARMRPDVVILDLKMPGMSGEEALVKLRELDPLAMTVVITGYATIETSIDAMKKGAFDFLPKPFRPDELKVIITRALEGRRLKVKLDEAERDRENMRLNFAAMLSHQLKSPLAAVAQFLLAIEKVPGDPAKQTDMLEKARTRIEKLVNVINSWLRLSSIEGAFTQSIFEEIDLREVVRELVLDAHEHAGVCKVDLCYTVPETEPAVVDGDRFLLKEMLTNILDNAFKYTPEGGKVEITLGRSHGAIELCISDSGMSIPAEDLPYIFEHYFRGKSAGKKEGTGLGLAISKKIAEKLNGNIRVESEKGKGSRFIVSLPGKPL